MSRVAKQYAIWILFREKGREYLHILRIHTYNFILFILFAWSLGCPEKQQVAQNSTVSYMWVDIYLKIGVNTKIGGRSSNA